MSLSIPAANLSFSKALISPDDPLFLTSLSRLSLRPPPRVSLVIRMGGGPRTYPGGVSKWQWKRMQAKKAKQLLKARLCLERQIYEMRKRAELKATVAELERPWEVVERAPNLFSVSADEQVKALADRFQRPGGFDLWTDRDGPQLFHTPDGIPSARFFPKGVVHSVKPYGKVEGYGELESDCKMESGDSLVSDVGYGLAKESDITRSSKSSRGNLSKNKLSKDRIDFEYGRKGRRRNLHSGENGIDKGDKYAGSFTPRRDGSDNKINRTHTRVVNRGDRTNRTNETINRRGSRYSKGDLETEVYDMSLQGDGSYRFQPRHGNSDF